MASRRVVVNGAVYEIEGDGPPKLRGMDAIELAKCVCNGNGCADVTIEYPGSGFVVRNIGQHRVRVGIEPMSGWDCGRWTHFNLHPDEARSFLDRGHCCPYDATRY
jgi:hypothetical protein